MTGLFLIVAGFFGGAGFRGYRIEKEHELLDGGWNGGWPMVVIINAACGALAIAALLLAARESRGGGRL